MSFGSWLGATATFRETKDILLEWQRYYGWENLMGEGKPYFFQGGSSVIEGTLPNDFDYFIFTPKWEQLRNKLIEEEGFTPSLEDDYETRGFSSLRRDKDNFILLPSPKDFYAYYRACVMTQHLEVVDRETRIYLYESLTMAVHGACDQERFGLFSTPSSLQATASTEFLFGDQSISLTPTY